MRFNCGLTKEEKRDIKIDRERLKEKARREWHVAFAWWPIRVEPRVCVWLERYERRLVSRYVPARRFCERLSWYWEYRLYEPLVAPVTE